mgnify:CR=1 FL=1
MKISSMKKASNLEAFFVDVGLAINRCTFRSRGRCRCCRLALAARTSSLQAGCLQKLLQWLQYLLFSMQLTQQLVPQQPLVRQLEDRLRTCSGSGSGSGPGSGLGDALRTCSGSGFRLQSG